jgi:light-regulated signal transduction histidine kinase (bacteriophytochrome)
MIGVGIDVTEAKQLAGELEVRAGELALADRRKDEFLAMLAHELRNPMAPLTMALHLVRAGAATAIARSRSRNARRSSSRASSTTCSTRPASRREDHAPSGAGAPRRRRRARGRDRSAGDRRARASLRGRCCRGAGAPPRRSGAARAVLANLLDNAAKYTPPGGTITLAAERTADGVALRVRDTGDRTRRRSSPEPLRPLRQDDRLARALARRPRHRASRSLRRLVELHGGPRRGPQRGARARQRVRRPI